MAESVFADKTTPPTEADLESALGDSAVLLSAIEQELARRHGPITREWKFYGKQSGWTLALKRGDRRIFHLVPHDGRFTVAFVLGRRAVEVARASDLPASVIATLDAAREYVEGRGLRLDMATPADLPVVLELAEIKLAH